ncbi:hypothetical protein FQA39_LY02702 [Lamprigera yunnana]|nr:hypothetical protein FQA39_LY02702 [Lamprigera yunnana]
MAHDDRVLPETAWTQKLWNCVGSSAPREVIASGYDHRFKKRNDRDYLFYMAQKLQQEYKEWGLILNADKTKYLPTVVNSTDIRLEEYKWRNLKRGGGHSWKKYFEEMFNTKHIIMPVELVDNKEASENTEYREKEEITENEITEAITRLRRGNRNDKKYGWTLDRNFRYMRESWKKRLQMTIEQQLEEPQSGCIK